MDRCVLCTFYMIDLGFSLLELPFFFFVNIAVVIEVAVLDVISLFYALLFFDLCVSMQWSLW